MELYPHQIDMSNKMIEREESDGRIHVFNNTYIKSNVGIYGDVPGYGRKRTILEMINMKRGRNGGNVQMQYVSIGGIGSGAQIVKYREEACIHIRASLIVTSRYNMDDWEKELGNYNMDVCMLRKKTDIRVERIESCDVIVCGHHVYNDLAREISKYTCKRFVYYENDEIYISNMKNVNAQFYWFVTSDPMSSLSKKQKTSFIGNLFSIFMKHRDDYILEKITLKNDEEVLKESYNIPEIQYTYRIVYDKIPYNIREMLIRDKHIPETIKLLKGNLATKEEFIETSKKEFEEGDIQRKINRYIESGVEVNRYKEQLKILEREKECYMGRLDSIGERLLEKCMICYETYEYPVIVGCCHQLFCGECLLKCLDVKKSCPLCREEIGIERATCFTEDVDKVCKEIGRRYPTKRDVILEMARDDTGESMYVYSYDNIFEGEGVEYTKKMPTDYVIGGVECKDIDYLIFYHNTDRYYKKLLMSKLNCIGRTTPLKVLEFNNI